MDGEMNDGWGNTIIIDVKKRRGWKREGKEKIEIHHTQIETIHHQLAERTLLGTVRVILIGKNNSRVIVRGLCDNGSQVNLVSQAVVQALNMKIKSEQTTLLGMGGNKFRFLLRGSPIKDHIKRQQRINGKIQCSQKHYHIRTKGDDAEMA